MPLSSTLWYQRRRCLALRFRALVAATAGVWAVAGGMWLTAAVDPIADYRIIHVPEAATCGRAILISRAEAAQIQRELAAIAGQPAALPATTLPQEPPIGQQGADR